MGDHRVQGWWPLLLGSGLFPRTPAQGQISAGGLQPGENVPTLKQSKGVADLVVILQQRLDAQVTFFFNSQEEEANPGEDRIMIPSLKVPSYENDPVMKAHEVTETLLQEVTQGVQQAPKRGGIQGDHQEVSVGIHPNAGQAVVLSVDPSKGAGVGADQAAAQGEGAIQAFSQQRRVDGPVVAPKSPDGDPALVPDSRAVFRTLSLRMRTMSPERTLGGFATNSLG